MKKLFAALLTSVFLFFAAAQAAEAIGCTPTLFREIGDNEFRAMDGYSFSSDIGTIWVGYPLGENQQPGENELEMSPAQLASTFGIHWCWNNTQGIGGAQSCQSNSIGSTYIPNETNGNSNFTTTVSGGQKYFLGRFTPFTNQADTYWRVTAWRNGGLGSYGTQVCPGAEQEIQSVGAYSCNNPGISYSVNGQEVNLGISVDATNMDPTKSYRAMIKCEGLCDLGGGWSIPLVLDGNSYTNGSTYGSEFRDGAYTVVIADAGNLGCNTITDNFDIRNCAVYPQCIGRVEIDRTDPTKQQQPDEGREQTIVDAAENRNPLPDTITPFSLCRQIPILTKAEIDAQVALIQDPDAAAKLRQELTQRSIRQQQEKQACCQCTYGTRFYDRDTGACQGEAGTRGEVDPSVVRQRQGFKPGIYTAVGCIPATVYGEEGEGNLITSLVRIGLGIAGGVALLMILAGAFMFTTSQGDPKRASEARELITSAVLGLVFIIFSVTLLQFIGVTVLHIPGFGEPTTAETATQ